MSGQKKLNRATRNIRVVATPSKKVERIVTDNFGQALLDKNGNKVTETTQLYRIRPMK